MIGSLSAEGRFGRWSSFACFPKYCSQTPKVRQYPFVQPYCTYLKRGAWSQDLQLNGLLCIWSVLLIWAFSGSIDLEEVSRCQLKIIVRTCVWTKQTAGFGICIACCFRNICRLCSNWNAHHIHHIAIAHFGQVFTPNTTLFGHSFHFFPRNGTVSFFKSRCQE